jgi:type I restriction enzyme, R subunit
MTAQAPARRVRRTLTSTLSRRPPTCGRAFAAGKGSMAKPRRSFFKTITMTAVERSRATIRQVNAVNAASEAIAKGQDWVLLVIATGTGKTYTAFQIIWRLWKAGRKKRILFLADRNVLIDQTMVNDFRPFGAAMAKLSTNAKTIERQDGTSVDLTLALDKKRRIDTAFEVYLGLYQAITGPEERQKLFKEFSKDFFDLIVIDECHRGSAAEDSAWREILTHFSGATQIGLTATPKETEYVSNTEYFGEPVFTYSLKQGISDGFLAPYKVIKVHIDRDVEGAVANVVEFRGWRSLRGLTQP